jgi:hypothetical protein
MQRVIVVVIGMLAVGCQGESPSERPPRPRFEPPPPIEVTAEAKPVDLSLGLGLEMRRPIRDGRLTIIPIVATRPFADVHYVTLDAAMAGGQVTVRELPGDESLSFVVDTLRLQNRSPHPLVVLGGELVIDGMQDRVIARDRVIPGGATVEVAVRCVEEDRDYGERMFHPGYALAELPLRQAVVHESQDDVWAQVGVINRRLHLHPGTKTYRLAAAEQSRGDAATRREHIVAQLAALEEHDSIIGFAVAIDSELVALDQLATPELYRQLEPVLLGSYVMASAGPASDARALTPADVRAFAGRSDGTATEATFVVLRERTPAAL